MSFFRRALFLVGFAGVLSGALFSAAPAEAAVCAITTDTVIDQTYVDDPGNDCTSIEIQGNVSTTWLGTVDLGGGTVTVKNGFTMTMGSSSAMVLGAMDDFVIETNASTTQAIQDPSGVRISARNVTIQAGGSVETSEKGCQGGLLSAGMPDGFGPNPDTGVCTSGASGAGKVGSDVQTHGGGGSYGGAGGGGAYSGTTYGDSLDPTFLGSGGGSTSGYGGGFLGGYGGGRIELIASGVLTIDGLVRANGGMGGSYGSFDSGSGSGGSISIRAATLAGVGSISANGGDRAVPYYGETAITYGGGGGRVKVLYDTLSAFDLSHITANAGSQLVAGLATDVNGTDYTLNRRTDDGAGALRINSGFDFPASGDYDRDSIVFGPHVDLSCVTSSVLSVSSITAISLSDATWTCSQPVGAFILASSAGLSTTSTSFSFSSVTSVTITVPRWTNVTTTFSLTKQGSFSHWDVGSNLELHSFTYTGADAGTLSATGGFLSIENPIALSLVSSTMSTNVSSTQLTSLSIDALSSIDASGKGCPGSYGDGYGPDATTGICRSTGPGYGHAADATGGGGGYGGAGGGGVGLGGLSFGESVSTTPSYLGASGGAATGGFGPFIGGAGGGLVNLQISGTFVLDGSITAKGAQGGTYGYPIAGSGSGGSIYVSSTVITGSGYVRADGGDYLVAASYGGGGGRVSIVYADGSGFDATHVYAAAGTQAVPGGGLPSDGSVHLSNQPPLTPTSFSPTVLTDGSTTGTNTPRFYFSLTDPDGSDSVRYRIQIDDSDDFGSPVVDFTSALAAQGTQSFQVGQATLGGSYSVGSVSQTLSDGTYYWRIRSIDPSSAVSGYATVGSIAVPAFVVDTAARTIQFQQVTASGLENLTATSIKLVLNTAHFEDVTVNYAVTGGTADGSGTDFTLAAGTATITAGNTSTTIPLTIVNDGIAESDETIVITLSSPSHASLGSNTTHTYTIIDNDTAGIILSKTTAAVAEGGSTDSYTIVLTSEPTSTVTVTPSANSQLTLSPTTLSFTSGNWSTPQTVTITATDDSTYEQAHSATITHSASSSGLNYNSSLLISSLLVNITDNESGGGGASGASIGIPIPLVMPFWPLNPPLPSNAPVLDPMAVSTAPIPSLPMAVREPSPRILALIRQDLSSFDVTTTATLVHDQAIWIESGSTPFTIALGEGERRALFRDLLDVLRRMPTIADQERAASGQILLDRNLAREKQFAPRALQAFKAIFGHAPVFSDGKENLAWNTLMYRIRFPRDLTKEKQGITQFKKIFKQEPKDAFQWALVRMMGYVK